MIKDVKDALTILIQAVQLGQKNGIYSFDEARLIAEAIDFFVIKNEDNNESKENK